MKEEQKIEKKEKVLAYLIGLPIYKYAAKYAGMDEDTLIIWRRDDPEFAERCEAVRSEAISRLGKRAKPEFILPAIDGETFGKKEQVEHTGTLEMRWKDGSSNTLQSNATPADATQLPD